MPRIEPLANKSVYRFASEIWEKRSLLLQFSKRQVAIRYKQSIVGIAWVVVQPLVTTAIFTLIFGILARIPSEGVPYPVFVLSGMTIWQYFSRVLGEGSGSLVGHSGIITKIYFPRGMLPIATAISAGIDFLVMFGILLLLMLTYGILPGWQIIFFPVFVALAAALGIGIALVLAPLNAIYRDIGFAVPFALQILMYLSPVIYPVSLIPENYRWLLIFNPLAPLIDGVRWSLTTVTPPPDMLTLGVSVGFVAVLSYIGSRVFMRLETTLVDRI